MSTKFLQIYRVWHSTVKKKFLRVLLNSSSFDLQVSFKPYLQSSKLVYRLYVSVRTHVWEGEGRKPKSEQEIIDSAVNYFAFDCFIVLILNISI